MAYDTTKSALEIKEIESIGPFHLLQIGRFYSCQAKGSTLFDNKSKESAYRHFDQLLINHLQQNSLWVGLTFIEQYEKYLDRRLQFTKNI